MIASDVRLKKKMMTLKNMKAGEGSNTKDCDIVPITMCQLRQYASPGSSYLDLMIFRAISNVTSLVTTVKTTTFRRDSLSTA